ncbi:MAG TPA: hypothetical protein PKO16_00740 [Bacteroidia bacterium]|jgi:hypothetical protein|nr:hypothetical protein [Bacteroidia bacterium]
MNLYPEAVGVRSHSFVSSLLISEYYKSQGVIYESNIYYPQQYEPSFDYMGFLVHVVPLCWSDIGHLLGMFPFKMDKLPITTEYVTLSPFIRYTSILILKT